MDSGHIKRVSLSVMAKKLNENLIAMHQAILDEGGEEPDQEVVKILSASLCKLTKILISDVNQKIDEHIFASEHPDLIVSTHQHGADLRNESGMCVELKVSMCKSRTNTCSFNWPVPKGATEEDRRKKLLESIKAKVGQGGHAILIVKDGLGRELAKYTLQEEFLMEYFSRIKLGKCGNHNMGCNRCPKCKGFHKLQKLQDANDLLMKKDKSLVINWTEVMAPTNSTC